MKKFNVSNKQFIIVWTHAPFNGPNVYNLCCNNSISKIITKTSVGLETVNPSFGY